MGQERIVKQNRTRNIGISYSLKPYLETVRDTAILVAGGIGVAALAHATGIPFGNPAETPTQIQDWLANPLPALLQVSVQAPLLEETFYRTGPITLLNAMLPEQEGKPLWAIGIPISAVFALMHIVNTKTGISLADMIPLQQFLSGLVFWNASRKRGIQHGYLAHSLNNALALGLLGVGIKI